MTDIIIFFKKFPFAVIHLSKQILNFRENYSFKVNLIKTIWNVRNLVSDFAKENTKQI